MFDRVSHERDLREIYPRKRRDTYRELIDRLVASNSDAHYVRQQVANQRVDFDQRLRALRDEHAKEVNALRTERAALLNRVSNLNTLRAALRRRLRSIAELVSGAADDGELS